jgi:hypothetical protein
MNSRYTTVERAYQLAGSGECAGVGEVKDRLRAEGFTDVQGQLYGPTITSALRKLCESSRAEAAAAEATAGSDPGPDAALTSPASGV